MREKLASGSDMRWIRRKRESRWDFFPELRPCEHTATHAHMHTHTFPRHLEVEAPAVEVEAPRVSQFSCCRWLCSTTGRRAKPALFRVFSGGRGGRILTALKALFFVCFLEGRGREEVSRCIFAPPETFFFSFFRRLQPKLSKTTFDTKEMLAHA